MQASDNPDGHTTAKKSGTVTPRERKMACYIVGRSMMIKKVELSEGQSRDN
jgi:hypothetical protein